MVCCRIDGGGIDTHYGIAKSAKIAKIKRQHRSKQSAAAFEQRAFQFWQSWQCEVSALQLGEPLLEKTFLGLLMGELERPAIGGPGLIGPAEPAAELGTRRMREAVVAQVAAIADGVDQAEARF